MKKIYTIIALLILSATATLRAQNNETEITVTDNKGKQEVIDLPEGMLSEVDSLLYLYNSKTYMKPASDCNILRRSTLVG